MQSRQKSSRGDHLFREAVLGGACAGAAVGWIEALWCQFRAGVTADFGAWWWGPLAYAILFAFMALGVSGGVRFVFRLVPRLGSCERVLTFPAWYAGALGLGVLLIGRWRYYADFFPHADESISHKLVVWGLALVGAALIAVAAFESGRSVGKKYIGAATLFLFAVSVAIANLFPIERSAPSAPTRSSAKGPDIFLIVVDTLRADHLAVYDANARPATPNVTAFANEAVLFKSAFAQSSWTKPSFGAILTGLYPSSHTATTRDARLPDGVTTLAEKLNEAGYQTIGFSNANVNNSGAMNFNQGFDQWTDLRRDHFFLFAPPSAARFVLYGRFIARFYTDYLRLLDIRHYYQPAEAVTDFVLSTLDRPPRADTRPVFMLIHYMDPHDPYMGGKLRGRGYARIFVNGKDMMPLRDEIQRAYCGDIEYFDRHFGRLIEGLKGRGRFQDAVIILTSDHGEEFAEHGGWWHGPTLYDEQIRVPLLIKLPGGVGRGTTTDLLARHIDIFPTVLRLAGLQSDSALPGQALLDETGRLAEHAPSLYVFSETEYHDFVQSVRTAESKLIKSLPKTAEAVENVEFYDLTADPGELKDLAGENGRDLSAFEERLMESRANARALAVESSRYDAMPPEVREQLRALGYIR